PQLLALSPEAFVDELRRKHGMVGIVEGEDFRFGSGRKGDVELLRTLGASLGFQTEVVPAQERALQDQIIVKVSSSLVRWLVGKGRVADAAICLNRNYALVAKVVRGEQRGRQIGVPTANLDAAEVDQVLIPAD